MMNVPQIPGFQTLRQDRAPRPTGCPHAHGCGDVDVSETPITVFRFRAPMATAIKSPVIFCGEIIGTAHAEAWKNGVRGGNVSLESGPNKWDKTLDLAAYDLIELRLYGTGTVRDLWILFTT